MHILWITLQKMYMYVLTFKLIVEEFQVTFEKMVSKLKLKWFSSMYNYMLYI